MKTVEPQNGDNVKPATLLKPDKTFSGKWINQLRQPMVYAWTRGEDVLYVGLATSGFARPIGPSHHRLTRGVIRPTDELSIYLCRTKEEAIQLEKDLIIALKPSLNGRRDRTPKPRDERWHRMIDRIFAESQEAVDDGN
jgi:hypothetical protein